MPDARTHGPSVVLHIGKNVGHGIAFDFVCKIERAARSDAYGDHIGIAQKIMQVTEGFLIGADQENAEVILMIRFQFVQRERVFHIVQVNETINLAVAVAGDIRQNGLTCGFLIEAVNGHHGEQLVDRPHVRERLKYAEIAVIRVGKHGVQMLQLVRDAVVFLRLARDIAHHVPENLFRLGAVAQRDGPVFEKLAHFVAIEDGVIQAFLHVFGVHGAGRFHQVANLLVRVVR